MKASLDRVRGGVGNTLDTSYGNNSDVPIDENFMRESDRRPVVGDKAIENFGVSIVKSEQPVDVDPTVPASNSPRSAMLLNMLYMDNLPQHQQLRAQLYQIMLGLFHELALELGLPGAVNLIPQGGPLEPFDGPAEAPADNAAPDDERVLPRGLAVCCSIFGVTFFAPIILIGAFVLGAFCALLKGFECAGKVGASLLSFSS